MRTFPDTVDLPHQPGHADGGCHACATALVEAWNTAHPAGTEVLVQRRPGLADLGVTAGSAEVRAGNSPAVRIDGAAAWAYLNNITVIPA